MTHLMLANMTFSGLVICSEANQTCQVDLMAMIGSVYVGKPASLHLPLNHSMVLPQDWQFVPGKVVLPFIWGVCIPLKNDISAMFFQKVLANYKCQGDWVIGPNTPI